MSGLVLRRLTPADENAFVVANAAWKEPNFIFVSAYEPNMEFENFLRVLEDFHLGRNLPTGRVQDTVMFGFLGREIVGRLSVRHTLNDFLMKVGGHIGYGVLPEFRRRGFATEMLRQSLPMARSFGIKRALLTCDDGNVGSRKTIETCGGVLENKITDSGGVVKRRYWIDLTK